MADLNRQQRWVWLILLGLCSLFGYCFITYFTERHESIKLLTSYLFLFSFYLVLYLSIKKQSHLRFGLALAIVLRFSLLFALPNLSDDFYRFIWDGRMIINGINPFAQLPSFYAGNGFIPPGSYDAFLYTHLNSPGYFTIYPPVCQLVFTLGAFITPGSTLGSVTVMRLIILAAELGSIFLMLILLKAYHLSKKRVLLYALNPLVILELSGNLHFEALMIFFLLLSIYLLKNKKPVFSAISFALAIGTKLIPLIFLPLFISRLGLKKAIVYFLITGTTTILLFLPLLSRELIEGLSSSLSLYFHKFEFNAGIYYLVREIGFAAKGYNIIGTAGSAMALLTFTSIIIFSFWEGRKNFSWLKAFMWVLLLYLVFTTTLHPWYVIPLVAFSLFTNYRFPVLWTALVFFTYAGYSTEGFQEQLWIVIIEYIMVFGFILYEILIGPASTKALHISRLVRK